MKIMVLSLLIRFLVVSAVSMLSMVEPDERMDVSLFIAPERGLSGVSRRKYARQDGVSMSAPYAYIASMDEDEDDDEDDDEDEYHKNVAPSYPSVTKLISFSDVKSEDGEENESEPLSETKSKSLIMSSLPVRNSSKADVPQSATDVIAIYLGSISDRFHTAMNEFFDNIEKHLKTSRELPLLENGDTWF